MDLRARSEATVVGLVAAACLFVATVLYMALQLHIAAPPVPQSGGPAALFEWWRPVQWLTTTVHLLAALGLVAIAVLGIELSRARERADDGGFGLGGALLASGGIIAAVAQLVQMGGNTAMLDSATTSMDPDILNTIGYTTDTIARTVQIVGYASLGVGVLAIALSNVSAADRVGRLIGVAFAVALLVLALFNLTDPFDLSDPVTGLIGLVLAPAWLWRLVAGPARGLEGSTSPAGIHAAEHPVQPS